MNLFARTLSVIAAGFMATSFSLATVSAQTIQPRFNFFNDVNGIGSEADFVRIGKTAEGVNTLEACENGKVYDMWIYIHNSAAPEGNGADFTGPAVARGTVLDVDVNADNTVVGKISADNAATITDSAQFTCADGDISLEYVGVSDVNFATFNDPTLGDYSLNGDPINGAAIGFPGGVVPGCWEYRARVNIQVKVVRAEEPVTPVTPVTPTEPKAPVVKNVPKVTTITDTGAANVFALFALVTVAGTLAFRAVASRR